MKPRLLDLFCGAGGCTKGYQRAGFEVFGIDIEPMPHYCGDQFLQADALQYLRDLIDSSEIQHFDVIHASPPCEFYTISRNNGCHKDATALIDPVRELLLASGLPYVIENVENAPLADQPLWGTHMITLCGASFGLGTGEFDLNRHRKFESSVDLDAPPCTHRKGFTIGVYGNGTNKWHREKFGRCVTINEMREAMGIDWMPRKYLKKAIPPAYTEYIGKQLMEAINGV